MSLSMSSGHFALDYDIVDRIMTFCSTLDTLRSTVLVSKVFYRVLQTHPGPKSIMRAVAYNIVGPALPQALRVVRYPYLEFAYALYNVYTFDGNLSAMAAACPEELHSVIIPGHEQGLLENARVVAALEDIYSLRNKNNKSRTTLLTSEESWRFRRAMYRIMLFCKLFSSDSYHILDMDDELIGKIRKQRTAVLDKYPNDELRELCSAVKFLVDILVAVDAPTPNVTDTLLSTGPWGVLRASQARSYEALEADVDVDFLFQDDNLIVFEGYFSLPIENICSERGIAPPKADDLASKRILDEVTSATDACSQCTAPGGLELYTEANWHRLPTPPVTFLNGHLWQNQTLFHPFYVATSQYEHSDYLGPLIDELFKLKTQTAPEFDNWDRTDSYCLPCLTKFLEEHLLIWLLSKRIRGGWVPPENCCYGWDCYRQISDISHAEQKNHLCAPIKNLFPA
ncbi:hypothetical protein B0H12DRAFT_1327689 [Mycena haematopus]|nr:hypothetical protein B0H12DRAFT_1327689 [Mycena haematopus]